MNSVFGLSKGQHRSQSKLVDPWFWAYSRWHRLWLRVGSVCSDHKRRQCHLYSKEHTCSPSLPGRGASSVEKNMFIFIPFLFVLNKVDEEPFFIIVRRRFFRKALNFDGKERHCGAKMDAFVCIPSQAAFAARVRALAARNV